MNAQERFHRMLTKYRFFEAARAVWTWTNAHCEEILKAWQAYEKRNAKLKP